MNTAISIKNGFCFGLDISSLDGDMINIGNDFFTMNGLVFTVGPVEFMIGKFIPAEYEDGEPE